MRAYVGIGSNLDRPALQVRTAVTAMSRLPYVDVVAVSSLYANPAVAPEPQPEYVNAVAALDTSACAERLLAALLDIESRMGRVRTAARHAARIIDLDLLLHGDERHASPRLTVPHPRMAERAFVLQPLLEIAPELEIPGYGPLSILLARVPRDQLRPIGSANGSTA